MNLKNFWMVILALMILDFVPFDRNPGLRICIAQDSDTSEIDMNKARILLRRMRQGESLNAEERAYLDRARAARNNRNQGGEAQVEILHGDSIGFKPLIEMTDDDSYLGQEGGLYGEGRNEPPADHHNAALDEIARIEQLDGNGRPDEKGKVVFISISMSNATQEFSRFKQLADADTRKSPDVTIVDCAQGGQAMREWANPDARPWNEADRRLRAAGVSPAQVQVAWIKLANKVPTGTLQQHGEQLQRDATAVIQNAKRRYPNLRVVYLSSRIYAGYATANLNPEPYAYESAFAVRWLIRDQIAGTEVLNYDARRGAVVAPLLLWGPYLWADGMTARKSDGLRYERRDLANDGTHPSPSGREKVARLILDFFTSDPLSRSWFQKKD
ncbi:MAG TPA: hypothetical protein PKD64_00100 [Pirellulaceae bacterium]|nr:hypothetical protein [Pirellulaceae bacterium]HMO90572.1 hypothetical protein [Pirellulaceae bacterium]HMP71236.1 hypothetical protein [Pirellulaceae bacterium]